jgi:hypothetical protein
MMKNWSFRIGLSGIFWVTFLAIAALPGLAQETSSTGIAIDDGLLCYMVKSDGTVLDLNGMCGKNANPENRAAAARIYSRPSGNLGGLDIFGRGKTSPPCYGLDDRGQRCPSSQ